MRQIKSLKPLSELINLEVVKLNNTGIKTLKSLLNLTNLKTVECYNTKITAKTIEKFKASKPDVEVIYY